MAVDLAAAIARADRADQRRARHVLWKIASGFVKPAELDLVVTVARNKRKVLRGVTIADLIHMGLIEEVQ